MKFKAISRDELVRLLAMAAALYEMDFGDMTQEQDDAVRAVTQNTLALLFPGSEENRYET